MILRLIPLLGLWTFASCNIPLPMKVVTIRPTYGWVDGCYTVKVSGHGFTSDAQVWLNDEGLVVNQPNAETDPLDVGYVLYAYVAQNTLRSPGFADLYVGSNGEASMVPRAFYFEACPGAPWPTSATVNTADGLATTDATVSVEGCSLSGSPTYTARVGSSEEDLPVATVCGTAQVTFSAPQMDPGTWRIGFFDMEGNQVYPDPACDITVPVESYEPPADADTTDTAWPWDPCAGSLTLQYAGGAR